MLALIRAGLAARRGTMPLQQFVKLTPAALGMGILFVVLSRRRGLGRKTPGLAAAVESALEIVRRCRSFIELAPDGILLADLTGRYTEVNDAACRMLGYSREELVGKTISDLIPPEEAERLRLTKEQLLKGRTHTDEWRLRRKDGSYLPVEVSGGILTGGRWQAFVRDISQRKQLEATLRDTNADLNRAQSVAMLGSLRVDLRNNRLSGSAETYRIYGIPPDTPLTEEVLASRIHPDDVELVRQSWAAALLGEPYDVEHRIVVDGQTKWVRNKAEFELDEHGALKSAIAIVQDITERRRAAHAQKFLTEVSAVLATTLDYEETLSNVARLAVHELADICIVETVEPGGSLRRLRVAHGGRDQAAALQELERLSPDLRRPHLGSMVLATQQPMLMREVSPAYLDSIAQSAEHRQVLDQLNLRSIFALPLIAHGRLVGSLVLLRTTESIYLEEERALAEDLAGRAALAVESARLYRLAQEAIEARDDVLGVVAHDLRNPVATILMQAPLLRCDGPEQGKRTQEASLRIVRAATHMTRLIEDLLDVTRIAAGRLSMSRAWVAPAQLVSEALDTQKPLAVAGAVQLSSAVEHELSELCVDRDRLLQVFENLIGNALKFTRPGGHVEVGVAQRGAEALFWVKDTGRGIGSADLPQVFNRFWQARRKEHGGAGLGLPIVKGIVEAHGGRVWVESALGDGSTFFFTIPAIQTEH